MAKGPDNVILGKIHNLIHADDTIILATSLDTLNQKVEATLDFYKKIEQSINIGKTKYMIIDSKKNYSRDKLVINDWAISYSSEEKYLGHYITDDNFMPKSIQLGLEERGANVLVKFRNFVNNHPSATLEICLNVFQICFTTKILSNCETWGPWIPRKVLSLYNQGVKLALGVRNSTPTNLIYLETRQPYVIAMIKKRQLNFWKKLDKLPELSKLLDRANTTGYIKH